MPIDRFTAGVDHGRRIVRDQSWSELDALAAALRLFCCEFVAEFTDAESDLLCIRITSVVLLKCKPQVVKIGSAVTIRPPQARMCYLQLRERLWFKHDGLSGTGAQRHGFFKAYTFEITPESALLNGF